MTIRPIQDLDGPALYEFFRNLPIEETTFFKSEPITSPSVADWATHPTAVRLMSVGDDGLIEGYTAVLPGVGLSSHVGEILLIVNVSSRHRGVVEPSLSLETAPADPDHHRHR